MSGVALIDDWKLLTEILDLWLCSCQVNPFHRSLHTKYCIVHYIEYCHKCYTVLPPYLTNLQVPKPELVTAEYQM